MKDVTFDATLNWSGRGKHGEGELSVRDQTFTYSGPAEMNGKGVGMSPEDFLVAGVSSCYSGTLFGLLSHEQLPVDRVTIQAQGMVTGYPAEASFSQLTVTPTIVGGDTSQQEAYEKAALAARDKCFVGQTIMGNVDYKVGPVHITNE